MPAFASINGHLAPAAEATVSVLDTGFTFGDGVYETLRTYSGRPGLLGRHLRRMRNSARRLAIEIPATDEVLAAEMDRVLEWAANTESYIRIIVTRGVGDISYNFDRVKGPTVVMVVKPYEPPPEKNYHDGIAVIIASVRRNHPRALDPQIKSCNLLNNILAMQEAQSKGALEPILLNDQGDLAEGAGSNVFMVKGGALITPPLDAGILPGVTREVVLELGRELGLPTREDAVRVADFLAADEAFITSTLKEAMPIRTVDGNPLGNGRPGPVTRKLHQAYRDRIKSGRP